MSPNSMSPKLKYSALLAIVVLSPPGMIRELMVRSCYGFRISTPFTPSLLKTTIHNKNTYSQVSTVFMLVETVTWLIVPHHQISDSALITKMNNYSECSFDDS
ncbi:hypothetical protein MTR_8g010150 [Medicago truncatula]|uniref:Uncharacterized protein n=1 Tax=Medicago truncatula TaxID=3880 RepID=A0A072TMG0_MEDTR|nr:hypothetical protein MTR_8g010150 [Medicago truncatula]